MRAGHYDIPTNVGVFAPHEATLPSAMHVCVGSSSDFDATSCYGRAALVAFKMVLMRMNSQIDITDILPTICFSLNHSAQPLVTALLGWTYPIKQCNMDLATDWTE